MTSNRPFYLIGRGRNCDEDEIPLKKMLEQMPPSEKVLSGSRNHDLRHNYPIALSEMKELFVLLTTKVEELEKKVEYQQKKIEEYEKQALPIAELVDDGHVEYEPLFPTFNPNKL